MLRIWAYQCEYARTRRGVVQSRRWCVQFCDCALPGRARHRPLRDFALSPFVVQFCNCILPGGVEPLPYAAGENFTDSHWCTPICNCLPHNPFVTAAPCHLSLHKGDFGWCCAKTGKGICPSRFSYYYNILRPSTYFAAILRSSARYVMRSSLARTGRSCGWSRFASSSTTASSS